MFRAHPLEVGVASECEHTYSLRDQVIWPCTQVCSKLYRLTDKNANENSNIDSIIMVSSESCGVTSMNSFNLLVSFPIVETRQTSHDKQDRKSVV